MKRRRDRILTTIVGSLVRPPRRRGSHAGGGSASFIRGALNEYYPSEEAYVYAVADTLHQEYQPIVDAGFVLQVDDAVLATMWATMEDKGLAADRRWAELRRVVPSSVSAKLRSLAEGAKLAGQEMMR